MIGAGEMFAMLMSACVIAWGGEWVNQGFGERRLIFYPRLSWILGAALSFVVPWNAVPESFIVIAQTMAGLCLFALARRFLPMRAALFGAACYAANPYALLNVYMRSDFAELLACALTPLVVLTALQLCGLMKNRRGSLPRAMAFFAVPFAAVWLSNAPAGVMASYSVAFPFSFPAVAEKTFLTGCPGPPPCAPCVCSTRFQPFPPPP